MPVPNRREFLVSTGALALAGCAGPRAADSGPGPADVTLRIGPVLADIAKDQTISTIGYNGSVPGPLVRLREGVPVTVDLFNDTDTPELVHWHGQIIPPEVDGASEEKSAFVPAHGHLRYRLTPRPAGFRFVHTHVSAGQDLHRGTYTGQFAMVYIEPKNQPGRYDQEVFLATHEWEPYFTPMEEEEEPSQEQREKKEQQAKGEKPNGWEVGYHRFTINGRMLGYGEPVRVKQGQRVMFHILNASATENIQLALPGHAFQVVALDGNAVARPQPVPVLELGTAERIDAIVEMNQPGVWVLGTPKDDDRRNGMGIVVEYAGAAGPPRWHAPPKEKWDYARFSDRRALAQPEEVIPMIFGKINGGTGGFNHWTVNGRQFDPAAPPRALRVGHRYRLAFDNRTDDDHPVHLHRSVFELVDAPGVMKDVVLVKGFGKLAVDVTPELPGLTLFHCHQQLHMDYGFMSLFNYESA